MDKKCSQSSGREVSKDAKNARVLKYLVAPNKYQLFECSIRYKWPYKIIVANFITLANCCRKVWLLATRGPGRVGLGKSRQNDRYKRPRLSYVNQNKSGINSKASLWVLPVQIHRGRRSNLYCSCAVCKLTSSAMNGRILLIVCLALCGLVHGYTLRDMLRERGNDCYIFRSDFRLRPH